MFSFFKRNEPENIKVPAWANFFNKNEYAQFLKLVDNYFAKKKVAYSFEDGVIITKDDRFGAHRMGLLNLSQTCKLEKQYKWEKIIFTHFEGFEKAELLTKWYSLRPKHSIRF